ncbi:Protein NHR-38 [Aphelenchoides avenae]|nr:Protein NHR-38 [Aphelenchus avenae]
MRKYLSAFNHSEEENKTDHGMQPWFESGLCTSATTFDSLHPFLQAQAASVALSVSSSASSRSSSCGALQSPKPGDTISVAVDSGNLSAKCYICDDLADGFHFNVLSCAACSAFFRRSISDQKSYSCATRACSVTISTSPKIFISPLRRVSASRKHGVICRYCRFQKCITVGMLPEEVQHKRVKQSSSESTSTSSSSSSTGNHGGKKPAKHSKARGSHQSVYTLLNDVCKRRRILAARRSENARNSQYELRNATFQNFEENIRYELDLFRALVLNDECVGHYANLDTLLPEHNSESFALWQILETVLATLRFGGVQTNRLYFTDLSYVDLMSADSLEAFFVDQFPRDAATYAKLCLATAENFLSGVCKGIQAAKFDEMETAAFSTLLLAGNSVHSLNLRQRILSELGQYYEINGSEDPAVRMGSMLLISSSLIEISSTLSELRSCLEFFSQI